MCVRTCERHSRRVLQPQCLPRYQLRLDLWPKTVASACWRLLRECRRFCQGCKMGWQVLLHDAYPCLAKARVLMLSITRGDSRALLFLYPRWWQTGCCALQLLQRGQWNGAVDRRLFWARLESASCTKRMYVGREGDQHCYRDRIHLREWAKLFIICDGQLTIRLNWACFDLICTTPQHWRWRQCAVLQVLRRKFRSLLEKFVPVLELYCSLWVGQIKL